MTDTAAPPLLSTDQVCQQVGITFRQLDHWVRRGFVTPSCTRSRHYRIDAWRGWTAGDLRVVYVVHQLRTKAPRRLFDWPRIATLVTGNRSGWLIVDGDRIEVADTPRQALAFIEAAACAICVAIPEAGV